MSFRDTWDIAVRVHDGQAFGITLGLWRDIGWYSCERTATEQQIEQHLQEIYEKWSPEWAAAERAKAKWAAEAKRAKVRDKAEARYRAAIMEATRDSTTLYSFRPFSFHGWDELLGTVRETTESAEDGSALVSLAFCHPQSIVFHDLKHDYTYFDLRSGKTWDLHFVGYRCASPWQTLPPSKFGIPLWHFRANDFDDIRKEIQDRHLEALNNSPERPFEATGWRYCGRPELVSFMAYRDYPGLIDWLSLRSVQLVGADGNYLAQSLGQIVEVMSDWRDTDGEALRALAPGEPPVVRSAQPIVNALRATASVLAAGIAGNAAYELIRSAIE